MMQAGAPRRTGAPEGPPTLKHERAHAPSMRWPVPFLLVVALAFAGCAQDPTNDTGEDTPPAAEDFRMVEGGLGAAELREPVRLAPDVAVRVAPSTPAAGEIVQVAVENRGNATYGMSGSDCGIHVARPEGGEWLVFGAAPGNFDDVLDELAPGQTCRTELDLSGVHVRRDGEGGVERTRLPPSDYRIVWIATERGAEGTALASRPLHVQGP